MNIFKSTLARNLIKALGGILALIIVQTVAEMFKTNLVELGKSIGGLLFIGSSNHSSLLVELFRTLIRFSVGYSAAVITALSLGVILAEFKRVDDFLKPLIEVMRPIPSAVVIPLALAGLGIGEWMKYFVIWFGAFWPLLIITRQSCRDVPIPLLQTAKVFHVSWSGRVKMVFRIGLPGILGGLKSSLAIALLLAITVEMIAGGKPNGLGYFIIDSERAFEFDLMLAGVIVLAVAGYSMNRLFETLEKKILERRYQYLRIGTEANV